MKKIIVILLVLCLCGCSNKTENEGIDDISILVPSGAPSLAFYNQVDNENFNTSDAQGIVPQLLSDNGPDIIVIDTVNGIKAIEKGANYKLAASITFGNFYIASTGIDEDDIMDKDDYIVLFSMGATPDLIFHYVYGNEYDKNIHYVSAVSDASACLAKGINIYDDSRDVNEEPYVEYVMIAEPALTVALSQNNSVSIYTDIQEEYKQKSNGLVMTQASVFVSNRLSKQKAQTYLDSLQSGVSELLSNPSLFSDSVANLEDVEVKEIFGIPNSKIATKVLTNNSIGLGYKKACDNKDDIDEYLSIFGMDKTNEEIYFK